jgi:choline-glycine betaine transporter
MSDPASINLLDPQSEPQVDWTIFIPSVIVVLLCAIPLVIFPDEAARFLIDSRKAIMSNFLWLYLSVGVSAVVFAYGWPLAAMHTSS